MTTTASPLARTPDAPSPAVPSAIWASASRASAIWPIAIWPVAIWTLCALLSVGRSAGQSPVVRAAAHPGLTASIPSQAAQQRTAVRSLVRSLALRSSRAPRSLRAPGAHTTRVTIGQSQLGFLTMIPLQQPSGIATIAPGIGGTAMLIHLFIPSTQRDEVFLLFVPDSAPTDPRPLLTFFHAYSFSHLEIDSFTSFLTEADERDWFVIAPVQNAGVGLSFVNYGSPSSQEHVEAVTDLVLSRYAIDRDRQYGAGFSMGGGSALSYAARHRDARQGAMAAVTNHTGSVALKDVYSNVDFSTQIEMIALFGGSPIDEPFQFSRSSLIQDVTPLPGARNMAVNLESVPVLSLYEVTDINQYLVAQTQALDTFMQTLPGADHTLIPLSAPGVCEPSSHCWRTAEEAFVCDWFETHTLDRNPTKGVVLADRNARWHHFDVAQDQPDAFTQFRYEIVQAQSQISITETENLQQVALDPAAVGLDPSMTIDVILEASDGTEDRIVLRGLTTPPLLVVRNGAQLTESCAPAAGSSAWCYDVQTASLTLLDAGPGLARWQIIP